jgi:hypothetical protein
LSAGHQDIKKVDRIEEVLCREGIAKAKHGNRKQVKALKI